MTAPSHHATCVVVGEAGILLRGASGSGKTRLGAEIIALARAGGRFADLVGDDRVHLEAAHGRLVARPVPAIAGLIERRGVGIFRTRHESAAVIRLIVDCIVSTPERLPDAVDLRATVLGVTLPRLVARMGDGMAATIVGHIGPSGDGLMTE
jgi:serine kinase of HPr protein (carbohydrate metabolism regulator)